jgi:hypothetical protein
METRKASSKQMFFQRRFPLPAKVAALLLAVLVISPASAWGNLLDVEWPPELWGNLVQSDNSTCGPVAVVNSLVYLQRLYPNTYNGKLVPSKDPLFPTIAEEQAVSTALL